MTIRPAAPADYDRLAPVVSILEGSPLTGDILREREAKDVGAKLIYLLAEKRGEVVGYARVFRMPYHAAGRMWFAIAVVPEHRATGIARALYMEAMAFASTHNPTFFESKVRDDDPQSIAVANHFGFHVTRHECEAVLNPSEYDESSNAGVLDRLRNEGLRFVSFAGAGGTEVFQRQLHSINCETSRDIPGNDPSFEWPFEQFQRDVVRAHWFRPEGQIVAFDGDEPIGLGAIGETSPRTFYNTMTGVKATHRGRGIATALKILTIRVATSLGAKQIVTNNDSMNEPMLAINRKLGYVQRPGWLRLKRDLT